MSEREARDFRDSKIAGYRKALAKLANEARRLAVPIFKDGVANLEAMVATEAAAECSRALKFGLPPGQPSAVLLAISAALQNARQRLEGMNKIGTTWTSIDDLVPFINL